MRRLDAPIAIQTAMCVLQLFCGAFNLLHHHYAGIINLIAFAVCFVITIDTYRVIKSTRRLEEMPRIRTSPTANEIQIVTDEHAMRMAAQMQREMQMRMYEARIRYAPYFQVEVSDVAAMDLALKNLKKVVKAVGGQLRINSYAEHDFVVILEPFVISTSRIYRRQQPKSNDFDSTCYVVADPNIPTYEKVAMVVLLLHNDSNLFWYWRENLGNWRI